MIVLLLTAGGAAAQWRQGGVELPDEPWRKSVKGFGAMLLVTDKPDAFFEAWEKPPSPDYQPAVSTTGEARRGSTVVAVVVFTKCLADEKGHCDAEVDFRVLRPDGSVYAEHKGGELWKGKPAPPEGSLQLGITNLGFRVEPEDPLGDYRLEAVVRDRRASIEIPLVQVLRVLPAE